MMFANANFYRKSGVAERTCPGLAVEGSAVSLSDAAELIVEKVPAVHRLK
jgi:hypothetical protein